MRQDIVPIGVRRSLPTCISEQSVVSHYENHHGNAVRAPLNPGHDCASLRHVPC